MEFAVVIAMIATAAVVVQYRFRSVVEDGVFSAAQEVMGQPTTTTLGRFQPRPCLDTSGDGLCDCMDTNRDGSCDGLNAQSGSGARESGPAPGRTTLLTESSTGSQQLESLQITPIAGPPPGVPTGGNARGRGGTIVGRAVPRGSAPTPAPPSSSSDDGGFTDYPSIGSAATSAGATAGGAPVPMTSTTPTGMAGASSSATRVTTTTPLGPTPVLPTHVVVPETWD
jgi:hypothetical protein